MPSVYGMVRNSGAVFERKIALLSQQLGKFASSTVGYVGANQPRLVDRTAATVEFDRRRGAVDREDRAFGNRFRKPGHNGSLNGSIDGGIQGFHSLVWVDTAG